MKQDFGHSLTGALLNTQDCNLGIGLFAFLPGGLNGEELLQTNSDCWQNSYPYVCVAEYSVFVFFPLFWQVSTALIIFAI